MQQEMRCCSARLRVDWLARPAMSNADSMTVVAAKAQQEPACIEEVGERKER